MPNSTLENKIDLLLSLHQDQNKRLKALEERIGPNRKEKDKKWISCSELGKVVGLQGRTIQKYVLRGLFPEEIVRKKVTGKTYQYRIEAERGIELATLGFDQEEFNAR